MLSKHLIAVVFLAAVSLGVLAFYIESRKGNQQEGVSEYENVDLPYLITHIDEFENEKVRVTGTVRYMGSIYMFEDFSLTVNDAWIPVDGIHESNLILPTENDIIIVEGTVSWFSLEGDTYYISVDSWA